MHSIKDVRKDDAQDRESNIADDLGAVAEKYKGKSENELMSALMRSVSDAKSNGSFSADQLDSFVGFVSPSLDDDSRTKLNALVDMIKNG